MARELKSKLTIVKVLAYYPIKGTAHTDELYLKGHYKDKNKALKIVRGAYEKEEYRIIHISSMYKQTDYYACNLPNTPQFITNAKNSIKKLVKDLRGFIF